MADKTVMKLDSTTAKKIERGLKEPFKKVINFFRVLSVTLFQDTQLSFRHEGARAGHSRWPEYARSTVRTPAGTNRIKYGTDGTPKPLSAQRLSALRRAWITKMGWGAKGEMRKNVRRYPGKMLQASGLFRQSFQMLSISNKRMLFGTKHKLAEAIMSNPDRDVLFITNQDEQRYAQQWQIFYANNMRF